MLTYSEENLTTTFKNGSIRSVYSKFQLFFKHVKYIQIIIHLLILFLTINLFLLCLKNVLAPLPL